MSTASSVSGSTPTASTPAASFEERETKDTKSANNDEVQLWADYVIEKLKAGSSVFVPIGQSFKGPNDGPRHLLGITSTQLSRDSCRQVICAVFQKTQLTIEAKACYAYECDRSCGEYQELIGFKFHRA